MNSHELAQRLAEPIGRIGMGFYFDPATKQRARELGLNAFEYYGLGRGGVLGDVDLATVTAAFVFFHPATMEYLWDRARAKADSVAVAAEYVQSAYEYADRSFADVDASGLATLAQLTRRVVANLAPGRCPLVDGYARLPEPASPVRAGYLATILLRELRGGLHIEAVAELGLSANEAAYLGDEANFALHGYGEADVPVVTPELRARRERAEELTTDKVAELLASWSDEEGEIAVTIVNSMYAAVSPQGPSA